MEDLKDNLLLILKERDRKKLLDFSKEIFPYSSSKVSEDSREMISDIINKLTLCHLTLIEGNYINSWLLPQNDYEMISDFLSSLRNHFKTVTKYFERFAQSIYFEINPSTISFLNKICPIEFSDRVFVAPSFELIEKVIQTQTNNSRSESEIELFVEAKEMLELTRDWIKPRQYYLWEYEKEWNKIQSDFLEVSLKRVVNRIQELSSKDTRRTLKWNEEKVEIIPKLYNLLSGKMIDSMTTIQQFYMVFDQTPLSNISHQIIWIDRLIDSTNSGIPTLSTLMNWLQDKELIVKQTDLDREILQTMKHCFVDNNQKPVTRKTPIGDLRTPKHEQFQKMLNDLLKA